MIYDCNVSIKDVFTSEISGELKLSIQDKNPVNTNFDVSGVKIGGSEIIVIAGPRSIENKEQLYQTAQIVKKYGASIIRGGAFKPRTSPDSFQGLQEKGTELLAKTKKKSILQLLVK